jgi:hypothetical protein
MVTLAEAFGFRLSRVKGSHHIFVHPQVRELVNFRMWMERPSHTRFVSSCVWSNGIILQWETSYEGLPHQYLL